MHKSDHSKEILPLALITSAKNEGDYIGRTIESVVDNRYIPKVWVIVDDGSTDNTYNVIKSHAQTYEFIRPIRNTTQKRSIFSKINALNTAYDLIKQESFEYIANLDADIVLCQDYYYNILNKFIEIEGLGIASGLYSEKNARGTYRLIMQPRYHTPGALQVFSKKCFDEIGGYPYMEGGEDAGAGLFARMKGWKTMNFPEISVKHLKPFGTGGTKKTHLKYMNLGRSDYHLGVQPFYAVMKFIKRMLKNPLSSGAFFIIAGYFSEVFSGREKSLPGEVISFSRREQVERVFGPFKLRKRGHRNRG